MSRHGTQRAAVVLDKAMAEHEAVCKSGHGVMPGDILFSEAARGHLLKAAEAYDGAYAAWRVFHQYDWEKPEARKAAAKAASDWLTCEKLAIEELEKATETM